MAEKYLKLILLAIFAIARTCRCTDFGFSTTLDFHIRNTGFHREILYQLSFVGPLDKSNCEFMLVQNLPASVFVNTDELNDLKRLKQVIMRGEGN